MRKNGETRGFFAEIKHHPPAVFMNSSVLSGSCAFSASCQGKLTAQGRILSTSGHKVVMPHGAAMCAQNGDRARRAAGNDGPENYRKSGKLSELNAGGIAPSALGGAGLTRDFARFDLHFVVKKSCRIFSRFSLVCTRNARVPERFLGTRCDRPLIHCSRFAHPAH